MRIIPKNTKVKLKFYKGISVPDILVALVALGFITLAVTSNLPSKWFIALGILMVSAPLFIPVGDIKVYQCIVYVFKFIVAKKTYSKRNGTISSIVPYGKILDNSIQMKAGGYTGIIEIKPIEFNMLSEFKQNHLIDGVFAGALKECGVMQEFNLIRIEKPVIFDDYISNEYTKIQGLIQANENGELNEDEFRKRVTVVEDRINVIDVLNSEEQIYASNYYLAIHDVDLKSLQTTMELIKSAFCANSIQAKILTKKELAIFIRYTYDKYFDEKIFNDIPEKDYLKNAIPSYVQFGTTYTRQNNKVLTHFVVTDYPLKVPNAWGEDLFDIENTKVVMKMKPVDKFKALKRLDNAISEISSQNGSSRASSVLDRQTHLETLQQVLEQLQNDNETLFDTTLIITAYDDKGKNTNKKIVRRKLREMGVKFTEMLGRQPDVYFSTQIDKTDKVNISRGIQSSSIAASFPFVSNAVLDEKGILIGENKLPVFLDFFVRDDSRVNSNAVIIGKSGSGKSFATKTILTHLASEDTKVFILDPENEYGNLAKNLNGKVLDVASKKDGIINPFHVIQNLDDDNNDGTSNSFYAHLQFLEEFFRLILQGINPDSLELLNKIILEVYNDKGINGKTDITKLHAKNYPIFDDLVKKIESKVENEKDEYNKSCLKVLVNYLSKFKSGGRNSNLWNGYTSFKPAENFVCFNFQKLLANKNSVIANAQMLLVLKWLENEVIKNRDYNTIYNASRKIIVVIDEAHVFIDEKFPVALDFMYQLAKRIRKYNGMQIVITQNIKDFVGSPEIARKSSAIINVSQYSLIFSLAPNDMKDLCTLYEKAGEINEAEAENIINLGRGSAFLITGPSSRTNIRIIATPYVRQLFEEIVEDPNYEEEYENNLKED